MAARIEAADVALGLDVVRGGFAAHTDAAGQDALVVQAPFDALAHDLPDLPEVVPDARAFAFLDVLPIGAALAFAAGQDVGDGGQGVDVGRRFGARMAVGEGSAADAVDGAAECDGLSVGLEGLEAHAVRVEGEYDVRAPDDLGRREGLKHLEDGLVGQVTASGGSQAAVEGDTEGMGAGRVRGEGSGGPLGAHRMAAGGPVTNLVKFSERFHKGRQR